jgi:hypothetical protein
MRKLVSVLVVSASLAAIAGSIGCDKGTPKPPEPAASPPPPAPPPAPAAAARDAGGDAAKKSKLAPAPTDGLSLAERMERRKADEAKLAAQLASDERQRLLKYDKGKLPLHNKLFAFIKKTRGEYDRAKTAAAVEKTQKKLEKSIVGAGKQLKAIDPKGGNSNVVTDYDVMLNALAGEYPQALAGSFDGDTKAITEQRAEMDKRTKKIEDWLKAVKAGK